MSSNLPTHLSSPTLSNRDLVRAQDFAVVVQRVNTMNNRVKTHEKYLTDHHKAIASLQDNQNNTSAQVNAIEKVVVRLLPLVQGSLATGGAAGAPAAAPVPAQGAAPGSRVAKRPAHAWNNFTKLYLPKCQATNPKERFKECAAAWKRLSKAQQQAFKAL
jgi:hypothetical protein